MEPEVIYSEMGDASAESDSAPEVSLIDTLTVLSKHRKFIFWFTIGTVILTAAVAFLLPNMYTATTVILPPGQNSPSSSALMGQAGGSAALASAAGMSLALKTPGDMYMALFRSRTVEDAVIQRFGLMARYHAARLSGARSRLLSRSKVAVGAKDGLITISVVDPDPKFAAELANGYVDEVRKLSATLAITEASQRRLFFQQQLLEANDSLATAEEAMKQNAQTSGVLQVDSQTRYLIESAATLRGQITAKEVQLQGMRSFATEDNPQVMMAEQQLSALRGELAKLGGTDKNPGSDIIVPKGNITAAETDYIRKLRDVKYYETMVELMARQFEMAKLDEARQGAVVQVVDIAVPPDLKSSPHRSIALIVALIVGFILSIGWVLLMEKMATPEAREQVQALKTLWRK